MSARRFSESERHSQRIDAHSRYGWREALTFALTGAIAVYPGFIVWAALAELLRPGTLSPSRFAVLALITASGMTLVGAVVARSLPDRRTARALYALGPLATFLIYSFVLVLDQSYPLENAFIATFQRVGVALALWGICWWLLVCFVRPSIGPASLTFGFLVILTAVFAVVGG